MVYNYSKYKHFVFFQENILPLFIISVLGILIILNVLTDILHFTTYEVSDIVMETLIIFLMTYFSFNIIMYNRDYNKIKKAHLKNIDLFSDNYEVSSVYESDLVKERKENYCYSYLFAIIPGILVILIGEYNVQYNLTEVNVNDTVKVINTFSEKDLGYGFLCVVTIFIYSVMIVSIQEFKIISKDSLIRKKSVKKDAISTYILEIKEHLKIFNPTSQFRLRVESAVSSITEIYSINKGSLERLKEEEDLAKAIKNKNKIIKNELKKMLFSIIEYNNERNDDILKSIQKNIDIINSLRG